MNNNINDSKYKSFTSNTPNGTIIGKLSEYYPDAKSEEEIIEAYRSYQKNGPDYDSFVRKDDGKMVVEYDRIREHIEKKFCPISYREMVFIFDGKRYRPNENDIEKEVHRCLLAVGYSHRHRMKGITDEIRKRVMIRSTVHELPFDKLSNGFIPCQNGILDIETGNLLPFSPIYGFRYTIHADYDQTAHHVAIDHFFNDLVGDNSPLLVQMIAQIIIGEHHKTAYYLYNSTGNNGKSTFAAVIGEFIGIENTSSVTLQEICDDKFAMAELDGKLANICPDLPYGYITNTSRFKALTGGDLVNAQRKYGQPFQFRNKAIMVFGSNSVPVVNDQSDAFFSRFILIHFPNQFKVDPFFVDTLTTRENLSGLLNLVIPEIKRITREGLKGKDDPELIKDQWKMQSDSAYAFVNERMQPSVRVDEKIEFDEVFVKYNQYCYMGGRKRKGEKAFEAALRDAGYGIKRKGAAGEQIIYVMGAVVEDISPTQSLEVKAEA